MGNDAINVTPKTGGDYPVLGLASPFMRSPFISYNGVFYNIQGFLPKMGIGYDFVGYLQAKDENSSDLKYRPDNSSAISRWKIVPVGEYRIVNMEYVETAGDFINRKDQSIDGAIVPNTSATQEIEHSISISKQRERRVALQKQKEFLLMKAVLLI